MHTVFISYSSKDADQANQIRSILETNDIPCWIAPRDIPYGSNYALEIPQAIGDCQVFLILMSRNAQLSKFVIKELDTAVTKGKPVLPLMLEDFPLNDAFDFLLSGSQRLEAYRQSSHAMEQLIAQIQNLTHAPKGGESAGCLPGEATRIPPDKQSEEIDSNLRAKGNPLTSRWSVLSLAVVLIVCVILFIRGQGLFHAEVPDVVFPPEATVNPAADIPQPTQETAESEPQPDDTQPMQIDATQPTCDPETEAINYALPLLPVVEQAYEASIDAIYAAHSALDSGTQPPDITPYLLKLRSLHIADVQMPEQHIQALTEAGFQPELALSISRDAQTFLQNSETLMEYIAGPMFTSSDLTVNQRHFLLSHLELYWNCSAVVIQIRSNRFLLPMVNTEEFASARSALNENDWLLAEKFWTDDPDSLDNNEAYPMQKIEYLNTLFQDKQKLIDSIPE